MHRGLLQQAVGQLADLVAEGGREQQACFCLAGTRASTFLMSWMKPMSSMRSASSSTRICTVRQVQRALLLRGRAGGRAWRPGCRRPSAQCGRSAGSCRRRRRSPWRSAAGTCRRCARLFDLGREFAGGGEDQGAHAVAAAVVGAALRLIARRCSKGRVKAAVLPVPVWAPPSRSRAFEHGGDGLGLDRGWGFRSPVRARPSEMARARFSSSKCHWYVGGAPRAALLDRPGWAPLLEGNPPVKGRWGPKVGRKHRKQPLEAVPGCAQMLKATGASNPCIVAQQR